MTLSLNDLMVIFPQQLWIEISAQEQEDAWQQTAQETYSNTATRWRAYLNCLCLKTFLAWLKEEPDVVLNQTYKILPQQADLPSFWEVVNGTQLTLDKTKLVLIPSDKNNLSFEIPQEWVDIPNWAAHYYLAVQLNLHEGWLRVCGYATHEQIQKSAKYNLLNRTYCLDAEDLIEDLNVMWVAREVCGSKEPKVKPLPTLLPAQAEKLLQRLAKCTPDLPRDVNFEQWAALIASDSWRQHLYQHLKNLHHNDIKCESSKANNLSQWLQNIFQGSWQDFDTFMNLQNKTIAVQFRNDTAFNQVCIKAAKLIDLGMQLAGEAVMLLVALSPEIDDKVSLRVQLHPANEEMYLLPDLRLVLLSQTGTILQEVISRSHDHYIQLKRFKFPQGTGFSIQVALGDVSIKEDFVLEQLIS